MRGANGKEQNTLEVEAPAVDDSTGDQLAQGFDLLFGKHLREQSSRIDRLDAETSDMLACLEKQALRQADSLDQLIDKSRAALEREQGEYRRRRKVEADMAEKLGQLRAAMENAIGELRTKADQTQRMVEEAVGALQHPQGAADLESQQELLDEHSAGISRLLLDKVDRKELAGLLTEVVLELDKSAGEGD
jgi:hypothetical protein